jgi:N-methylhydantoinase B
LDTIHHHVSHYTHYLSTMSNAVTPAAEGTPVEIELLRNALTSIADEMAITEVRAAYSTVVRDLLDFSTAVCDSAGRVLAQGLTLAIQLGAIPRFMRLLRERVPEPAPGDVYLVNDPWQGGVHLPDFFFAKPVFIEGGREPIAYAGIVTHMVDVGGRFPGGISVTAASLWEEGLIIPIVPLVQAGTLNRPLLDVIAANVREPVKVLGDIRAALAGLDTCERQVKALADRLGPGRLVEQIQAFLDYSERSTRAALRAIPDGEGYAEGYLDDDGVGGPPVRVCCRVVKRDDRLRFDYTGTDAQVPGGINCAVGDVASVSTFVAGAALGEDAIVNDGFSRCIEFEIPEGTVASARRPAAVSARGTLLYRLTDVAGAAMAQLVSDRIPAENGNPGLITFSGHRADGSPWICLDFVQAGWGASADHDGVPGASHAISNTGNIPIESIEQEFPVRVVRSELLPDTAGAGRFNGAPAVVREYLVEADGVVLGYRVERQNYPPQGSGGGTAGAAARCYLRRRGGDWEEAPPKFSTVLGAGDGFRMELPGGAGFGPPGARSREAVRLEIADGLRTEAEALRLYGGSAGG